MMHRRIAVLLLAPLKQRELCHPQELILILIKQLHLTRKLQAKRAQDIPHDLILIRRKEQEIPILSIHRGNQSRHLLFRHKLCKR